MRLKNKVLVFGGTTEGRILSDYLRKAGILHEISVATEYGKEILLENGEENLLVGRKNFKEIEEMIKSLEVSIVVDATHPFATAASKEIKTACKGSDVPYLRLKRSTEIKADDAENVICVDSIEDASKAAEDTDGNILVLTGSKDLEKIASIITDTSRVFVRVLPNEDSIGKCIKAGFGGKQIIAMQGPFSKQMNIATIKEIDAKAIITKESGKAGGFEEKIEAAMSCGIKAIVVRNPENALESPDAYSLSEIIEILSKHTGITITLNKDIIPDKDINSDKNIIPDKDINFDKTVIFDKDIAFDKTISFDKNVASDKAVTLAGMGPGDESYYTLELKKAIDEADIIFGAKAVVNNLKNSRVPVISEYEGQKIYDYLKVNNEYINPLVLFSGDISLCSGAKKATALFEDKGYKVNLISGISSVTLFAQKLGLGLEDVRVISAHGRKCDVIRNVTDNIETIVLTSDAEHARNISEKLISLADKVILGCDLGTFSEKIIDAKSNPDTIKDIAGKCLVYTYNENATGRKIVKTLCDDEIIRGNVPMTKEEIRALSMRKLSLSKGAVFYDIGSGTGSISLEAALLDESISVYSVEKNEEAIELLRKNIEIFNVSNIEMISGLAPDAMKDLPAPSHVFIGGSSGNIKEIIDTVYQKNSKARIVINTVTAETFAQVMGLINEYPDIEPDVIMVSVSRFKKVGRYHLADALNPVYIITL